MKGSVRLVSFKKINFIAILVLIMQFGVIHSQTEFFEPELILIEPTARLGTSATMVNPSQGGSTQQGKSNFIASPKSNGFIKWKSVHADKVGECRIRINDGNYEQENSFAILQPASGIGDEEGWFKCGRYANRYEQKQVKFPDLLGDICTLQLQFKTAKGIINQCADISLVIGEKTTCEGLGRNGGKCVNGRGQCLSGFGGKYCDGINQFESDSPSLWFILFIILVIVTFMALFAFCVIRFINRKEKRYHKTSPENSITNDAFKGTIFQDESVRQGTNNIYEERVPYKHHRFVDEE